MAASFAIKHLSPACSQQLHRACGHFGELIGAQLCITEIAPGCLLQSFQQTAVLLSVLLLCSVEYNMSYAYHAVSSYFNRDNVALPGFVSYFRDASIEERDHAQMLMDFQVT